MFGISLAELLIVIFIAIFVIKPQDLPQIAHFLGKKYAKIKKIIANLQNEFEKSKKEIGFDEIKQEFNSAVIQEEINEKEKQTEIIDIYGNVHKISKVDEIRSDLSKEELEAEIEKYNKLNS
jgi:Sec-independent protein translocase protein TatA